MDFPYLWIASLKTVPMVLCMKCNCNFRSTSGFKRHYHAIHEHNPGLDIPVTEFWREYHPLLTTKQCDERGEFLTSDEPPASLTARAATDWFPFNSHIGFKLAEFIFTEAELSRRKADYLLELWTATLVPYSITPPIADYRDLLQQVDSIPLRDILWESFCLSYDNPLPQMTCPLEWKTVEYEVWFRNPQEVIKSILSNPEFDGHVDYSAF